MLEKNKKLVIIVGIAVAFLAIIFFWTTVSNNRTPDFLRARSFYEGEFSDDERFKFRVLKIRDDGWILIEGWGGNKKFVNTEQIKHIGEIEKPERWGDQW